MYTALFLRPFSVRGNKNEKSTTIHRNKTVLKCIKCMFLYPLSLECSAFRTSCGVCKGRVHDLIVRRVKYEYVHKFIDVGCVCVLVGWRGGGIVHAYREGEGVKCVRTKVCFA